jgi:oligopeptidase A
MNPLLEIRLPIPFDEVRAEHVEPAIRDLLADAQASIDRLAALEDPRDYESTLGALDRDTERLDYAMSVVRHLEAVATTPEMRAAHNAVDPLVSEFHSRIPLNEGLWRMLRAYAATPDAARLEGARKRYLERTLDYFRLHGAELDPAGKQRLAEIDVELSRLTNKFSENVIDATAAFDMVITDERKLAGLPPSAVAAARASAAAKGVDGWRFTLQAPSYLALMTYLDDRSIRETFYRAYSTRATREPFDNRAILPRILELRKEKAKLLGFADFADLALHDRMAKSGSKARAFLADLHHRSVAAFQRENDQLANFRREREGLGAPRLEPWDAGYYAEKLRSALYDFDEEALRPYFALENVLGGMFELVSRIYGIRVSEQPGVPGWHPDVKYYRIEDAGRAAPGGFYADWFPRETKRGGAWMDAFLTAVPGGAWPHVGLMCGNLTPPVDGKPALLTHREVETIFHEFGHLLHHCLSRVEVRSLAGANVAWDFVELPSQIMENWCWERESLNLFARHWETAETIPEDLFTRMRRARTYRAANAQMRQLSFGIVDLALHCEYEPERDGDVVEYSRRILEQFSPAALPQEHAMIAAFTHLFGSPVGYGAGYYSYKWAEVLEADAFTRFLTEGIFSAEVGGAFRRIILERGDSEDPAELYRAFMGREPDLRALLVRSGLA